DEEGKVGVLVPGLLEARVEIALHALPDGVPQGTDDHAPLHRRVIGHLRLDDDVGVPAGVVLAPRCDGLGHALSSKDRGMTAQSVRRASPVIGTKRTGSRVSRSIPWTVRTSRMSCWSPDPTGTIIRPPTFNWSTRDPGTSGGAAVTTMASKGASSGQP